MTDYREFPPTDADLKTRLHEKGISVTKRDGEYRVALAGKGNEEDVYYTDDREDAYYTGADMARRRDDKELKPVRGEEALSVLTELANSDLGYDVTLVDPCDWCGHPLSRDEHEMHPECEREYNEQARMAEESCPAYSNDELERLIAMAEQRAEEGQ